MNTPLTAESPDKQIKDSLESYQLKSDQFNSKLISDNEDSADQWGNVWDTSDHLWDEL